jgi:oxalate decarboxylase/phosphoglucose isomerase-like protein (cupin superfamily)
VREQVDTDLPASHDIAAAQQHLKKGAIRELHWHRVVRRILLHCLNGDFEQMLTCVCRQNGAKFFLAAFLFQL